MISAGVPCGDDLAAVDAGAGADVDDVVGGADRVLVVLDDEDGVAEIAQALERLEQARVVALMQADRRLVEHVEHAGEARADLRGEADALALAARQRAGGARERQIVEADVVEEFRRSRISFRMRDAISLCFCVNVFGRSSNQTFAALIDSVADFADVLAADLHAERLRLQAIAVAGLAGCAAWKRDSSSRTQSLSVSRQRRSMLGITPSNAFSVL